MYEAPESFGILTKINHFLGRLVGHVEGWNIVCSCSRPPDWEHADVHFNPFCSFHRRLSCSFVCIPCVAIIPIWFRSGMCVHSPGSVPRTSLSHTWQSLCAASTHLQHNYTTPPVQPLNLRSQQHFLSALITVEFWDTFNKNIWCKITLCLLCKLLETGDGPGCLIKIWQRE